MTAEGAEPDREASNASALKSPKPRHDLYAARQTGDTAVYWFYFGRIGLIHVLIYLFLDYLTAFLPRFAQQWVSSWVEDAGDTSNLAHIHTDAVNGTA